MHFDRSFFETEIREGFEVPELMKRAWAAALEVLEIVDDICKKHDIRWFADSGTMLGAVRHSGFIPWDDDIDIAMLRGDYNRFIEVVKDELPEGFVLVGMYADDKRLRDAARVQQLRVMADEEYWNLPQYMNRFHGFPCFRIGIDIFPLDYVSMNEDKERKIYDNYYLMMEVLTHWDEYFEQGILVKKINQIEERMNTDLSNEDDVYNALWKLSEKLISSVDEKDAKYVTNYFFKCVYDGKYDFNKESYDTITMMPFEHIKMPVPDGYDNILTVQYGDYMVPKRAYDAHEYPFYKDQAARLSEYLKGAGITCSLTEFCHNWYEANLMMEEPK